MQKPTISESLLDDLTTVFPRLEGEDQYTVMPFYKKLGVGAYRNGETVIEKTEDQENPKETKE